MKNGAKFGGVFFVECYDKTGNEKWRATAHNMVVNEGINYLLDLGFTGGSTQVGTWYVGLLASTVILSTYQSSNLGKATEYSEGTLPIWVESRTNQTLSNTGNLATFSIDKDGTTIEGAYLKSSNSKSAAGGIIMCAAPFSGGSKIGDSGDSLRVTYKFVGSDDTSS